MKKATIYTLWIFEKVVNFEHDLDKVTILPQVTYGNWKGIMATVFESSELWTSAQVQSLHQLIINPS